MRQGQQALVFNKIASVDLLDPPGEGAGDGRCRLPARCGCAPACGLLYMLPDRVHVVTGLVAQVPFTGALDHLPVGIHLVPFVGFGLRRHLKQMGRRAMTDLHTSPPQRCTALW